MKEEIKKIKKIIQQNPNKRILILGTRCSGKKELMEQLENIEDYSKIYDQKLVEHFGYIDPRYIREEEKIKLKKAIEIKLSIPMFSEEIIPCDLIIFLNMNKHALEIKAFLEQIPYDKIKNTQEKIKQSLKTSNCKIYNLQMPPQKIDFQKTKRVVYLCGIESDLNLTDKKTIEWNSLNTNALDCRFPYIKKVQTLKELKRKQGFLAIIHEKLLPENWIELDKHYRAFFKNFTFIYILTQDLKKQNKHHLKYSPFYFVSENYFDDERLYRLFLNHLLTEKTPKIGTKKRKKIEDLKKFIKGKNTFTTEEVKKAFPFSERQIERYLQDLNFLHKTLGYDFQKKEWYQIKTTTN